MSPTLKAEYGRKDTAVLPMETRFRSLFNKQAASIKFTIRFFGNDHTEGLKEKERPTLPCSCGRQ
jgi:hypothetical protein